MLGIPYSSDEIKKFKRKSYHNWWKYFQINPIDNSFDKDLILKISELKFICHLGSFDNSVKNRKEDNN